MANSRILTHANNLAVSSTITMTAGATETGYSTAYLVNQKRGQVWRSTSTASQVIVEFAFSSATVKAVSLVNWKRMGSGAVSCTYWDGAAFQTFGGANFASASSNPTKTDTLWDTTGKTTTNIRITFAASGTDYCELGYVYIGSYIEPTRNIEQGFTLEDTDASTPHVTLSGRDQIWAKGKRVIANVAYGPITQSTDLLTVRRVFDSVGMQSNFIWALDPSDNDYILYGRLTNAKRSHMKGFSAKWRYDLQFQEAL